MQVICKNMLIMKDRPVALGALPCATVELSKPGGSLLCSYKVVEAGLPKNFENSA